MKNSIISEYCGIHSERMKADGLLEENGEPLFQSEADFVRYCEQIIRDRELETLKSEVMFLGKLANVYQKRFNIVGSVHMLTGGYEAEKLEPSKRAAELEQAISGAKGKMLMPTVF